MVSVISSRNVEFVLKTSAFGCCDLSAEIYVLHYRVFPGIALLTTQYITQCHSSGKVTCFKPISIMLKQFQNVSQQDV